MSTPGTLPDEEQKRLTAQILSLIRAAYGEDAQFALAIAKVVVSDGVSGLAVYSSGSTADAKQLASLFALAATHTPRAELRRLAVETGDPDGPKQ